MNPCEAVAENNLVDGVIAVHLANIIDNDLEGFLDLISKKMIGTLLLMVVQYRVVGHMGDVLYLYVEGEVHPDLPTDENE